MFYSDPNSGMVLSTATSQDEGSGFKSATLEGSFFLGWVSMFSPCLGGYLCEYVVACCLSLCVSPMPDWRPEVKLVCFRSKVPKYASTWGHEQMAGYSPSGCFGIQQVGSIYHSKTSRSPDAAEQPQTFKLPLLLWCSFSKILCYLYAGCYRTQTF